jgi:hypothetical protein
MGRGTMYIGKQKTLVSLADITASVMKKGIFCDVTPHGSCKNRRFGGT